FDAEVDHVVAVIFEDDLDEIFADVVDVALHGGENHLSALLRVRLLHELLEMAHGGFHCFGGLKDFGDDQLVVVEEATDFGHAGHEGAVDDIERCDAFGEFFVEVSDEAVLGAFEDVIGEALIERQIGGANFLARTGSAEMLGDGGDVKLVDCGFLLARLAAPIGGGVAQEHGLGMTGGKGARRRIEEQVFGKGAFGFGNRGEALDAFGVDDGEIEAGLRAVIQEHGIDDFARAGGKAEGDVGNTEHGADVRKLLLDEANAFDRLDGAADIIFVAGGAGEDEGIEDDVGRGDRVFFGEQAAGALGDFEFALSREGLRLELVFVNAAYDERGAIGARERADALEFFLAVLEIDGVDDALALAIGEGEFDGAGVRGVDHERGFNFAYELFVEGRHVLEFVALGALEADVNDMRAAFHLAAGDFGGFLPLVGGDEIFEQARADYVGAFADDERAGAVFGFDDLDAGIYGAMI